MFRCSGIALQELVLRRRIWFCIAGFRCSISFALQDFVLCIKCCIFAAEQFCCFHFLLHIIFWRHLLFDACSNYTILLLLFYAPCFAAYNCFSLQSYLYETMPVACSFQFCACCKYSSSMHFALCSIHKPYLVMTLKTCHSYIKHFQCKPLSPLLLSNVIIKLESFWKYFRATVLIKNIRDVNEDEWYCNSSWKLELLHFCHNWFHFYFDNES